jgi:hypothetical protein
MRKVCAHRSATFALALWLVALVARVAAAQEALDAPIAPASAAAAATTAQGTIAGSVLDVVTADPLIDAGVELVGKKKTTRTDIDGKFSFKVPAGEYEVRVFAPGYQGARITKITVKPGQTTLADTTLSPEGQPGVEVVEVVAQANKAAEATQILTRQKADTVQETISAETIKKSPDSDAAEVVTRVPAVTVKDGYIFVRGLGERYSSALLNGSRLSSTDPNKRVVPLNLFPADFLASLAIIKSYTPDLPGDFSGGLVDINLVTFPTEFEASIGMSLGANTSATLQDFDTYKGQGGAGQPFGINTARGLPKVFGDKPFFGTLPQSEQFKLASALDNVWSKDTETAPPNGAVNFSIGNSWGPFGVNFATIWKNEFEVQDPLIERIIICESGCNQGDANPTFTPQEDFKYNLANHFTTLGGVLTSGYEIDAKNRITFRSLYNLRSLDQVYFGSGVNQNQQEVATTRLQFTQQQLAFGQLAGQHVLPGIEIDWRSAFTYTTQDIPDARTTAYELGSDPPLFSTQPPSGTRVWFDIDEKMTDSAVDFSVPFPMALPATDAWDGLTGRFKFGPAFTFRDRNSNLRNFSYRPRGQDLSQTPEVLLDPNNILDNQLTFQENTSRSDSFNATEEIAGFYGMFDVPLWRDWLRLVAGVRTEYSYIDLKTYTTAKQPLDAKFNTTTIINNLDPIPGINLIVTPRRDMNVRAGYSKTVSRPEFRELSPIQFPEPLGLRTTVGNPDLIEAHVQNVDLRWEWFYTPLELVSASFFYKLLDQPIETVLQPVGSSYANSFANAKSGTLWGFEVEGRKSFGFLSDDLTPLSLSVNAAYIQSSVELDEAALATPLTTPTHELQGQSPYVINAALEYSTPDLGTARFLYVTSGERITALGFNPVPNIVEQPRNQLDFVWFNRIDMFGQPVTAKLAVENLWNDHYLYKQGDLTQSRFRTGVKVGLSFSYDFS